MINHQGLSTQEVADRIRAGQVNATEERKSRSVGDILRANIFTRFNALLSALGLIVFIVAERKSDAVFVLIIFINSAIGIIQELRAKHVLDRLAIMNAPTVHAIRNGKLKRIRIEDVVLGDLLKLKIGDQVPTDGVVLDSNGLEIDESLLTGESEPIIKLAKDDVLSGSIVVAGSGHVRTTAVGADSYVHKLTAEAKEFTIAKSELVTGINILLKYISWIIAVGGPILIWSQIINSQVDWKDAVVRSTAAITGMIPEGLVLLTSIAFAYAIITLARRKVLVQQLPAVEGLARVDVICLDKTGTLTEGKIILDDLVMLDSKLHETTKSVLATISAEPDSPTLQALQDAFGEHEILPITLTIPFSSGRKWSAITLKDDSSWIMGAPEVIWPDKKSVLRKKAQTIAMEGKRVIALMRAETPPTTHQLPEDSQPVALLVLSEKLRNDAKETLQFFAKQGVTLKIISGDNPQTVGAIARSVGLNVEKPLDARDLPKDINELADVLETHNVFGRVAPDQKQAFVRALQSRGHVVAMTGDGVNDVLALKNADIGIAMGSGTPATRAIAEIVLLDNQFSRLPNVLAEGRRVIANIERVANLFIVKNVYSFILGASVTIASLPFPFFPRHLTLLTALTVGIPSFFLGLAPNNQRYRPGFLMRVLKFSIPTGVVIGALIFISYFFIGDEPDSTASAVSAIVVMVVGVWILYCLARPLNWWKAGLVLAMPGLFMLAITVPYTSDLLNFSFPLPNLLFTLLISLLGILVTELLWRYSRRTGT